ncbi:uncharacterized monothiol glutaredoxin ycf64-like [Penaeus vannamei]|nr:glutaredoxin-related protein 5, mitochondrial-like [Penaeus vannamei]
MFSAVKFARAARPSVTGFLRYCSAQVGSKEYFDKLVEKNKVVVFMKGTPDMPRCGFSNAVVQIMRMHGVNYDAHNVLADDSVRQGIKEYSDWPTIPQVFINGDFVGGCDILLQMHQSGELIDELQKVGITSALLEQEMENDKGEKK